MRRKLLRPNFTREHAESWVRELIDFRNQVSDALAKAPPGKIHIVNSRGRVQHYLRLSSHEKSGKYISQTEKQKLSIFLQKSYDERILGILNKEIKALETFLEVISDGRNEIREVYDLFPEKSKAYIQPVDVSDEAYIQAWLATPYTGKAMDKELTAYKTDRGEYVRSKSELNIANALYRNNIPYKYECPLQLDRNTVIYPDFTILVPRTREIIYWEHRGMMDDRDYARHAVKRIKDYQTVGVYLGKNLIITEETATIPLGTQDIKRVIDHYLK